MLCVGVNNDGESSGPEAGWRVHELPSLFLIPEFPRPDQASCDGYSEPVVMGAIGSSQREFGEGA